MTWTPARVSLLEEAERATHNLITAIENVKRDSPQKDSLILANEHLAAALELIQGVLEHARNAQEFTETIGFVGESEVKS